MESSVAGWVLTRPAPFDPSFVGSAVRTVLRTKRGLRDGKMVRTADRLRWLSYSNDQVHRRGSARGRYSSAGSSTPNSDKAPGWSIRRVLLLTGLGRLA